MTKIPYFAQAITENSTNLPINLRSITLGDPFLGNPAAMIDVPMAQYLNEENQILGLPDDVMSVFNTTSTTCGFDSVLRNLTYPPHGTIAIPGDPEGDNYEMQERQASPSGVDCAALSSPTTAAEVSDSITGPCFDSCATGTTASNYLFATKPWYDHRTCISRSLLLPICNF